MQIGGKTKIKTVKPTKPQFVVQKANGINEYLKFQADIHAQSEIVWVGDPNAATKFDSKYQAKTRVRELEDVPATRYFKELEG